MRKNGFERCFRVGRLAGARLQMSLRLQPFQDCAGTGPGYGIPQMCVAAAEQPSLQLRFNDQKCYPILPPTGCGVFLLQGGFQIGSGLPTLTAVLVIK